MVSVIIPAYNAEKTMDRCVKSILTQTYKDIEILIVNDGSTDQTLSIAKMYEKNYSNVKVLNHKKNKGLFAARLTGVHNANGEYIAFVDSDDHVSVDFYRLLVRKAMAANADVVYSNFFLEFPNGERRYFNHDPIRNQSLELHNEEVLDAYLHQAGAFYGWHVVWNKLYKRELWNQCIDRLDAFSKSHPNLNMTEDIAFTTAIMCHAHTVVNVPNAIYYYYRCKSQMTANKKTFESNINKLKDVIAVFDFFKTYLCEMGLYEKYRHDYDIWKRRYGFIYRDFFKGNAKVIAYIEKKFINICNDKEKNAESYYFYRLETKVTDKWDTLEKIKKRIASKEISVVSFDVFDTCILRNVWFPTDVFVIMNSYFEEIAGAKTTMDFASIRTDCEKEARGQKENGKEDITIDDIYHVMTKKFGIDPSVCKLLKQKEIELELKLSRPRNIVKELYSLSLDMKKKVVFTSDMYLHKKNIASILKQNGYTDYNAIYVSGDEGVTKASGNLYKRITEAHDCRMNEIVHIGDGIKSDYLSAMRLGIHAYYLKSVRKCFIKNSFWKNGIEHDGNNIDMLSSIECFVGFRGMLALAANRIYDNPFISIHNESEFDASPLTIGYFVLGMYLYSITKWMSDNIANREIQPDTIHFVARDGYLVQKAYELIAADNHTPKTNYLYVSRKAMFLSNIESKTDLLSVADGMNVLTYTPSSFISVFSKYMKKTDVDSALEYMKKRGYHLNQPFPSRVHFNRLLTEFIKRYYDRIDWDATRHNIKEYLEKQVSENDVIFDIGYSGRTENIICSLLGLSVDSYYVHSNSEILNRRSQKYGFKCNTFYDYKPNITGVIRERVFMKNGPSVIGYLKNEDGVVVPAFENYNNCFSDSFSVSLLQRYALEFVNDIHKMMKLTDDKFYFRYHDAVQPFEHFLHHGRLFDRMIFADIKFEDDFTRSESFNALDFWTNEMLRANAKSRTQYLINRFRKDKSGFIKQAAKRVINKLR